MIDNVENIWKRACEVLKSNPDLELSTYEQWFMCIVPVSVADDEIVLGVSDDFFGDFLLSSYEYAKLTPASLSDDGMTMSLPR